jgi:uncharacterized membrane protein
MLRKQPSHFSGRFDSVDALRGFAMVWMTAFHFSFDLNQFGYLRQDFYRDPVWTVQRTLILSLFLFCAGMGQALAVAQGQTWPRFWRRWIQVLGCALMVTASSWLMYPQSFIYFGVLHGMALMLILARCMTGLGGWLWLVGAAVIATKFIAVSALQTGAMAIYSEYLNTPALNWLGLITRKPVTEDYVPLLPWFGVMLWGVAAGHWLIHRGGPLASWALPTQLQPLVILGRWSLTYYMVHQPVMIGLLMAVAWVTR